MTSDVTGWVVRICYDFFDQFGDAPLHHFQDEAERRMPQVKAADQEMYKRYLVKLPKIEAPNPDYVLSRINTFVKARNLESAAIDFANLIVQGNFDEAQNLMYEALRSGVQREEVGMDYLCQVERFTAREEEEILVPTGFSALDDIIGGFRRKQLICFMGGYKGMKSWVAMRVAEQALLHGLKVLHISHEMTEAQIEDRYDMMLGGMTSHREPRPLRVVFWGREGEHDRRTRGDLNRELPDPGYYYEDLVAPSIWDEEAVSSTRRRVQRFGGRLIVRKYPMGACTMSEIRRYVNYLETFEDFNPDVIVNDYADIMAPMNPNDHRDNLNKLYIQHKRLADERNCLVITVSQVRRDAISRERMDMKDFAEDIRKAANVDMAIAICQSEHQKKWQQGALWIVANRDGEQGQGIRFGVNLNYGQIGNWSIPIRDGLGDIPASDPETGGDEDRVVIQTD
jgi:replicative DNA helicase